MERPGPLKFFRESLKSDAFYADEFLNIYLLRPAAAAIVWILYPTGVTPNQVTVAAVFAGFAAAAFFLADTPGYTIAAGLLVCLKDILDDADGQLARAKQLYSRRGRFFDSIGDFVVNLAIFSAITTVLLKTHPGWGTVALGFLGLLGITLRVSYHVYYQVSFLHGQDRYGLNRIIEVVTDEDRRGDPVALRLQKIFNLIYGWQDRFVSRVDRWCKGDVSSEFLWYSDRLALRISGLIGFGTEFALLTVCAIADRLYLYLILNLLMNGIMISSICYRRFYLRTRLMKESS